MPTNNPSGLNTWPPAQQDQLRELHSQGLLFSQIARIMGITRNAAIGKAGRMGLGKRPQIATPPVVGATPKNPTRPKKNKVVREPKMNPEPYVPLKDIDIPKKQLRTLMQLEPHHCRWPIGDEKPYLFCGGDRVKDCSYCSGHKLLSHRVALNVSDGLERGARLRKVAISTTAILKVREDYNLLDNDDGKQT